MKVRKLRWSPYNMLAYVYIGTTHLEVVDPTVMNEPRCIVVICIRVNKRTVFTVAIVSGCQTILYEIRSRF
jgi:S-adenosylmethionine hydrolase